MAWDLIDLRVLREQVADTLGSVSSITFQLPSQSSPPPERCNDQQAFHAVLLLRLTFLFQLFVSSE